MRQRDEKLDLIRGISALLVLMAHVRAIVFVDFGETGLTSLFAKGFYFLTGIHHQAVMVFFVLSGYFVGGSVLHALRNNSFTWQKYATARLTRLWIVLIPALFLTLGADTIGQKLHPTNYTGALHSIWSSGPAPTSPADHSLSTFLGNCFFLQTIELPVYGSNGPLWSLANEFWYYVLFPLFTGGLFFVMRRGQKRVIAIIPVLLSIGMLLWLPQGIVEDGLIWLLGVAVWFGSRFIAQLQPIVRGSWSVVGMLCFLLSLFLSKSSSPFGSDLAVGLAFALWMPMLLGTSNKSNWARSVGKFLSEISYTLYVIHFPIVILLGSIWVGTHQHSFGAKGILIFVAMCLVCLICASVMWWLFERQTNDLRLRISSRLGIK